jgi:hypothetical protein
MEKFGQTNNNEFELIDLKKIIKNHKSPIIRRLPSFVVAIIKKLIHEEEINKEIELLRNKTGIDFILANMKSFNISTNIIGLENIPDQKRLIFACNHPLGGIDFYAAIIAASHKYEKVKVIANEILMNFKNLQPLFLPVNSFGKTPKKYHQMINEAYESDIQIMTFPAGEVSRKRNGLVRDCDWHKSFIRNAVHYQRDIVPLYIHAKNSNLFYGIAQLRQFLKIRANLELFLLPDELFRQKNKTITIVIGKPISYAHLTKEKSHFEWAQIIKESTYSLEEQIISQSEFDYNWAY